MATIAELKTVLTTDDSGLKRGLASAQTSVQNFANKSANAFKAILAGAGIVAAFRSLSHALEESEERLSKLNDTAARLGVGIPELQRLQYAAQQAGVSSDGLNTSLGRMLKTLGEASMGNAQAVQAFSQIGISVQEIINLAPDQQYIKIAEALKSIGNAAQQAAATQAIFGKGGLENLTLVKEGVADLVAEYKELGVELSTKQVQSVEKYGDQLSKLGTLWNGFKDQLAAAVAGPLSDLVQSLVDNIKNMGGLQAIAKKTGEVIKNIFNGAASGIRVFDKAIQATAVSLAYLQKLWMGVAVVRTKLLGSDESFKNAKAAYQAQGVYIETLKKQFNEANKAKKQLMSNSSTTESGQSSASAPANLELLAQKTLTDEYNKQLQALQQAVKLQQQKIQNAQQEKSLIDDLVNGRGGENDAFNTSLNQFKKIQEEVSQLSLTSNSTELKDIRSSMRDFSQYIKSVSAKDLRANRVGEIQQALNLLNDPRNQFGAGNTDRQQQVELKVVVQAQEGLEAKIAQSKANKDVILNTVNEQFNAAAREIY